MENRKYDWPEFSLDEDREYVRELKEKNQTEDVITEEMFDKIKILQHKAFPTRPPRFKKYNSLDDYFKTFIDPSYPDNVINCLVDPILVRAVILENTYAIYVIHRHSVHLLDFGSSTQVCGNIFSVINAVIGKYKHHTFFTSCRDLTTYKLYKFYEKKGFLEFIEDRPRMKKFGEIYHNLKFILTPLGIKKISI